MYKNKYRPETYMRIRPVFTIFSATTFRTFTGPSFGFSVSAKSAPGLVLSPPARIWFSFAFSREAKSISLISKETPCSAQMLNLLWPSTMMPSHRTMGSRHLFSDRMFCSSWVYSSRDRGGIRALNSGSILGIGLVMVHFLSAFAINYTYCKLRTLICQQLRANITQHRKRHSHWMYSISADVLSLSPASRRALDSCFFVKTLARPPFFVAVDMKRW